MKFYLIIIALIVFFLGCSHTPQIQKNYMKKTYLLKSSFKNLQGWELENHKEAFLAFTRSCKTKKAKILYKKLCKNFLNIKKYKLFFENNFTPYKIITSKGEEDGLLTGYYEPLLKGSLHKNEKYKYPIYETPLDLISVDLSSIYKELKHYRLRGRVINNKLVPYTKRGERLRNAKIICYVDSKIDLFFLEVQGSGRVLLDTNETLFLGYDNQNGYKYRSIGKYLLSIGALKKGNVSLQSIKKWLQKHPKRVDEVLNYNKSMVFFKKRKGSARGSLRTTLTKNRSIAVDKHYIALGSMLYYSAEVDGVLQNALVVAEDTGGAIKGAIRADLFLGYGEKAQYVAGKLQSSLNLWVLLPKKESYE